MTDRYSRRFSVLGLDEDGDVQAIRTDALEEAGSALRQMEGDLSEVGLVDHLSGSQ